MALAAGLAGGCGAAEEGHGDAALARGREERAFWACYDRARTAFAANDVEGARAAYRDALERKPDHPASLYALAGIEHRAGRHDEALALARRLEQFDRPKTRALLLRAAIRGDVEAVLASGAAPGPWFDLADADDAIREAELANPEETGPHVARAKIAFLRGDLASADAALGRVLLIHPLHAEALVLRSAVALRRSDASAARDAALRALAATQPKVPIHPPGEGDTRESLAAAMDHYDTQRLRALAAALVCAPDAWPADAPPRPAAAETAVPNVDASATPLRVAADFDGDGVADELIVRRATERDALLSLFGVREPARGSFSLRVRGEDRTDGSGLDGLAVCAGSVHAVDIDADGALDVVVLPGAGDPARREPPLLLRNAGGGRFEPPRVVIDRAP